QKVFALVPKQNGSGGEPRLLGDVDKARRIARCGGEGKRVGRERAPQAPGRCCGHTFDPPSSVQHGDILNCRISEAEGHPTLNNQRGIRVSSWTLEAGSRIARVFPGSRSPQGSRTLRPQACAGNLSPR